MDDVYRLIVMKSGTSLVVRLPSSLVIKAKLEPHDELKAIFEKTGIKIVTKRKIPDSWKKRNGESTGSADASRETESADGPQARTPELPKPIIQPSGQEERGGDGPAFKVPPAKICRECAVSLTHAEADFSARHFGDSYCRTHQDELKKLRQTA